MYIWTCVDQKTKLMPFVMIGKRSAAMARRFMADVSHRLEMPKPHASDAHAFQTGEYLQTIQISTDGFAAYPEAVDLAFGPYVKYGTGAFGSRITSNIREDKGYTYSPYSIIWPRTKASIWVEAAERGSTSYTVCCSPGTTAVVASKAQSWATSTGLTMCRSKPASRD
jgi:hypothetical protein